jgi:hypothetical protein
MLWFFMMWIGFLISIAGLVMMKLIPKRW